MKLLAALLLLLLPVQLPAQDNLARTYASTPTVSLRIWLPAGHVQVQTWEQDSIRVTGTVARGSRFFGGGGGGTAKLGVEADDPRSGALGRADLVVTVPMRAQVWVKSTDAIIESWRTLGDLEILTVGGQVHIVDARGVVSIETIDAPIRVRGAVGTVRLHTGGGAVMLRDITGDLTVSTVRGGIDLAGEALGDARVETIDGNISIVGRLRVGALLEVQSHAGDINLWLPPDAVPALELGSRGGSVANTLGLGDARAGRLHVRSFKGRVNVTARAGVEGKKPRPSP